MRRLILLLFFTSALNSLKAQQADTLNYTSLTYERFSALVTAAERYVLVAFKADWCLVCKKEAPLLSALAQENKDRLQVLVLDLDDNPLLGHHYELDALPVHYIFSKGELKWSKVGMLDTNEVLNVLKVLDKKKNKK